MNIIFSCTKKSIIYYFSFGLLLTVILFFALSFKKPVILKTADARIAYIISLGYNIDTSSETATDTVIPVAFSDVYKKYNELLKTDGFDLAAYSGRTATVYTYSLNNLNDVFVSLIVSDSVLIGGDVHESKLGGTMLPLFSGANYEFNKT